MIIKYKNYNIELIDDVMRLVELWPIFQEALEELNVVKKANFNTDNDTFFKGMMFCIAEGCVIIIRSKNNKFLALGGAYNASSFWNPRKNMHIYVTYSNGKDLSAVPTMFNWFQEWAKENGFSTVTTWAARINNVAFRYYEQRLGFRRKAVVFEKELD